MVAVTGSASGIGAAVRSLLAADGCQVIGVDQRDAGVIGFLLGPASGYVHGSVLFADGGTDALVRPDAL